MKRTDMRLRASIIGSFGLLLVAGAVSACEAEAPQPGATVEPSMPTAVDQGAPPTEAAAATPEAVVAATEPAATSAAPDAGSSTAPAADDSHEADSGQPVGGDAEGAPDVTIDVEVVGGVVTAGGLRQEAPLDSVVLMRITSDVTDNVHVHGYDFSTSVGPGMMAELKFRADVEGVFEVELEESKLKLFDLMVR